MTSQKFLKGELASIIDDLRKEDRLDKEVATRNAHAAVISNVATIFLYRTAIFVGLPPTTRGLCVTSLEELAVTKGVDASKFNMVLGCFYPGARVVDIDWQSEEVSDVGDLKYLPKKLKCVDGKRRGNPTTTHIKEVAELLYRQKVIIYRDLLTVTEMLAALDMISTDARVQELASSCTFLAREW